MAKPNTATIRSDPEFKKIIDETLKRQDRSVKTSRVTKAIANQYKKYPQLLRELLEADLR